MLAQTQLVSKNNPMVLMTPTPLQTKQFVFNDTFQTMGSGRQHKPPLAPRRDSKQMKSSRQINSGLNLMTPMISG